MGKILTHWSVALLTVFAITYLAWNNPTLVQVAKLKAFDYQLQNEEVVVDDNLIYVTLGEKSIEENGQWPWPRDKIANLIWELRQEGAGIIILPILFSEEDRFGKDQDLWDALNMNGVVIAQTGSSQKTTTGVFRPVNMVGGNKDASNNLFTYNGMLPPIFNSDGVGVINTAPEVDGVVRRVPLLINVQNELYPNIAVEALRVMVGVPNYYMKTTPYGIDSIRVKGFPIKRGIIKTDDRARLFLRWNTEIQTLDYKADALYPVEGKTVIIGITAEGLANPLATPIGEKYPHEIIGATLSTIILGETVSRPMWADLYELGVILAMGIIIVIAAALLPYMVIFGLMIGTGAGIIYGVGYFFTKELWLLDPTMPLFMLTLVGLHGIFNRFVKEFQLKQQIKKQFGTYLSPAMVQKLQKNPELLKLGGDTRHMTFLFCDIRGFTPISEQYKTNPQGLTELVNRFLTPMTDIIMENDGTIDKYMGDCIMAFWNAPLDVPDQEGKAVKSAVKMLEHLKVLNKELELDGMLPINIGIGINSGSVVVGNMGSNQRFDYSVLGDAVNLAARLEGQSKGYGVKTIIGEDTAKEIDDMFAVLELDKIAVKGKTEGVKIFTVLGEHKWWNKNSNYVWETQQHDKMLQLYRQKNFDVAAKFAEDLIGSFRGVMDSYYMTWIERCEEMKTKEIPDNWDGTYVATTK
jgi:adenylate cyclase